MISIVIPIKRLALAKSRLTNLLDPEARQRLVVALATHVVTTAQQAVTRQTTPVTIWLTSADPIIAALARSLNSGYIPDQYEELNATLVAARTRVQAAGAHAMIVVAGDLPFLTPTDINLLIDALDESDLVLAPDQSQRGTNALALHLPTTLPFAFGDESAVRHLEAAQRLGLRVRLISTATLAFDLDDGERLQQYYQRVGCCGANA